MGKYNKMSAKDKAFEREKVRLRSEIQKKNDQIASLTIELNKCRAEADSWEKTARLLESYIGISRDEILADIERHRKITSFLEPLIDVAGSYMRIHADKFVEDKIIDAMKM